MLNGRLRAAFLAALACSGCEAISKLNANPASMVAGSGSVSKIVFRLENPEGVKGPIEWTATLEGQTANNVYGSLDLSGGTAQNGDEIRIMYNSGESGTGHVDVVITARYQGRDEKRRENTQRVRITLV
jgi:hypothetical protein